MLNPVRCAEHIDVNGSAIVTLQNGAEIEAVSGHAEKDLRVEAESIEEA